MPKSFYQDLSDRKTIPDAYRQYVHSVSSFFNLNRRFFYSWEEELCYYYFLMHLVDQHIGKIVDTVKDASFFENTIFVLTSDHGELVGSHGGGIQKWHNGYEESIHVPMIVSGNNIQKFKNFILAQEKVRKSVGRKISVLYHHLEQDFKMDYTRMIPSDEKCL